MTQFDYQITRLPDDPITRLSRALFDPPRGQYFTVRWPKRLPAAAGKVRAARQRLLEETPLLQHLAEDDAEHLGVARVGHRLDARSPPVDEALGVVAVFLNHRMRRVRALPLDRASRF